MGQIIKVLEGTDATFRSVLKNRGVPISFPPDATFDAFLSSGPGKPPRPVPSVEWIDPSAGSFEMSLRASQIATLDARYHHVLVIIVRSGENRCLAFDGRLEIVAAPAAVPLQPAR